MRCQNYSRWMIQAAAGGLSAAQEEEMRAHVSGCGDCSLESAAAWALVGAINRSVEAMVSGEPLPGFEARLRARLAAEAAPSRWLAAPRWAFAGAGLAVALLALLFARGSVREAVRPTVVADVPQAATRNPVPWAAAELPSASLRAPGRHLAARASQEKYGRALEFEVLVPCGQLAAAMELNDAVNGGRVDGEQLIALAEHSSKPLEWGRIEIIPLMDLRQEGTTPAAAPGSDLRH